MSVVAQRLGWLGRELPTALVGLTDVDDPSLALAIMHSLGGEHLLTVEATPSGGLHLWGRGVPFESMTKKADLQAHMIERRVGEAFAMNEGQVILSKGI